MNALNAVTTVTTVNALSNAATMVMAADPPSEVTAPAATLFGWALWVVVAIATTRLMYIGGKWGLSRISDESFTHTTTEIIFTLLGAVLAATAGSWLTLLQDG